MRSKQVIKQNVRRLGDMTPQQAVSFSGIFGGASVWPMSLEGIDLKIINIARILSNPINNLLVHKCITLCLHMCTVTTFLRRRALKVHR